MKLKLKICGMRDPDNIRSVVKLKPDYLGFIFYSGSPRYFSGMAGLFHDMIPEGIGKIGVFVNEQPDTVLKCIEAYHLDMIQLHGNETPEYCSYLKDKGIPLIKAIRINTEQDFNDLEVFENICDYFLFDTGGRKFGGTGEKFDWELLGYYNGHLPFFLSGGIGPEDTMIIEKLDFDGLFAIDINSRFEISPGIKNVELIETFMQSIKQQI
jgi:phosphoribosylanthranilate isomerase